ncbi:ABC transporter permease [Falsibacillus pallidus]|uniref:Putative ABC transport system permease protein n=1 Tax=Falsibacillus pallidus TaxID=493781 RepID=A0A370GC08_9BACI|nr:FtsX-like permease family protein [Falsibacillus pallidus]RDI41237.1 putative ABC transport system permease protein [Falsibacillus pallidus]
MSNRYKAIIREMRQKKWQYGGTSLLIFLAVLLYIMLSASISAVENSNIKFKNDYNQEDFHFYTSSPISGKEIDSLQKEHGVRLEKRLSADALYKGSKSIRFFNVPESVNIPFLSKGKLPSKPDELALSAIFAKQNHIKSGDELTVGGKQWKVTGLFYLPDYIYSLKNESDLVNDSNNFGLALATEKGISGLGAGSPYYIGEWDKGHHSLKDLKEDISTISPIIKWVNAKENSRISYIDSEIKGTKSFTTTLPIFISIIAMMMVVILIRRRLDIQRKQIGTQLALGYRPDELIRAYLIYPVVVSLSGSIFGIAAGAVLSIPLTDYYTTFFNLPVLSRWGINPLQWVGAIATPLVLLTGSGYWVIRKQVRQSPIHLLKPAPEKKKVKKNRKPILMMRSFKNRFRIRMISKNIGRILYLTIGICFATILLMYGFISMNSIDVLINKTYKESINYQYGVYYQELKGNDGQVDGDVFSIAEAEAKTAGEAPKKIQLYGVDDGMKSISLRDENGRSLNPSTDDGIVLSKVLAYTLHVKKGDSITVKLLSNGKEKTLTVQGVAEMYTGTAAYLDRQELNGLAQYPKNAYLGKWTNEKPRAESSILMVENKQDMMDTMESLMGPMRYSIFIMAGLAFMIGLIIITLITNLIVDENMGSISLLKVIGYEDSAISKLLLNIYTPVVVIAYLIGVPAAMFSIDGLMKSMASQTNYVLPVSVNPVMFILGFVLIFASYYTSILFSRRKLRKVSLQEVLKRQEA